MIYELEATNDGRDPQRMLMVLLQQDDDVYTVTFHLRDGRALEIPSCSRR